MNNIKSESEAISMHRACIITDAILCTSALLCKVHMHGSS